MHVDIAAHIRMNKARRCIHIQADVSISDQTESFNSSSVNDDDDDSDSPPWFTCPLRRQR